jgi:hypothetical protein
MGALTLDECLRDKSFGDDHTRLGKRFQKELAKAIATPWLLATGDDFRYPETEGARPGVVTRLMHRYVDHVMEAANENPQVFVTFFEVAQLIKPPTAFFRPSVMGQVATRMIGRPSRGKEK